MNITITKQMYTPPYNCQDTSFNALPSKYTKIDEYLIRGPHPSVKDLRKLKTEGVNQIYDFRHLSNFGFKFIEKYFCKFIGIKYTRVPYSNLYGNYPDLSIFEKISSEVKQNGEQGGKTLFHCNSGRHRTAHFAAFYKLTNGEPLNKVMQKENYQTKMNEIVKEHILDKDYFSRHKEEYHGFNIIKRAMVNYNNKIVEGLDRAQKLFLSILHKNS